MVDRRVRHTGKNREGDITSLCGDSGSADKTTAIRQIEYRDYRYFVAEVAPEVDVKVVHESGNKYVRTAADRTSRNNLDNLPDC